MIVTSVDATNRRWGCAQPPTTPELSSLHVPTQRHSRGNRGRPLMRPSSRGPSSCDRKTRPQGRAHGPRPSPRRARRSCVSERDTTTRRRSAEQRRRDSVSSRAGLGSQPGFHFGCETARSTYAARLPSFDPRRNRDRTSVISAQYPRRTRGRSAHAAPLERRNSPRREDRRSAGGPGFSVFA